MLTADELEGRRQQIEESADLQRLLQRLERQFDPVVQRQPVPPPVKAMLTADGGLCPVDGSPLEFDPWRTDGRHRCPRCGREVEGERHLWRWAWYQHLWLGERLAHGAALAVLGGNDRAGEWVNATLCRYGALYPELPNRDNVLGPGRLFFSTYLESIWLTSFLAAAGLLREAERLESEAEAAVSGLAEEAANLIGEFDEGLSNRQTWHNAALTAAAVWFGDEDLAERAISGARGLIGHLVDGFLPDGLWYEGENYHLFALRGLLVGAGFARLAGVDLFEVGASQDRLVAALLAPARTALPDDTFPARGDSRFGVSLAQPMYLEIWEAGLPRVESDDGADQLGAWLARLYGRPAPAAQLFDSYLHEAGEPSPERRSRSDLSWWMLTVMQPELPSAEAAWKPGSRLFPDQGLAVLRQGPAYAGIECGPWFGGHGHPDRLHLTYHDGDVQWLPDPGTGMYVSPDLFWYRSTLAHNAPRLAGASQAPGDAEAEVFDSIDGAAWAVTRFEGFTRTTVLTPTHFVDQLEFAADHPRTVELAWHPVGDWQVESEGTWQPGGLDAPQVAEVSRFVPAEPLAPVRVAAREGNREFTLYLAGHSELLRATGPGLPGRGTRQPFLLLRQSGQYVRFLAAGGPGRTLRRVEVKAAELALDTEAGTVLHQPTTEGWEVRLGNQRWQLAGRRRERLRVDLPTSLAPALTAVLKAEPTRGRGLLIREAPVLDGSAEGFAVDSPLFLDHDDQYRRSEEAYPGPGTFAATAWVDWNDDGLFLMVEVIHPGPVFRPASAPPLRLDNEVDDVHSDGLQVYVRMGSERAAEGVLVVPEAGGGLRVRPTTDSATAATARGAWQRTGDGYRVTLALVPTRWPPPRDLRQIGFDLIVNRMEPDRQRRAGQLVWSGGGGWVYLRGDRQAVSRLGLLDLT